MAALDLSDYLNAATWLRLSFTKKFWLFLRRGEETFKKRRWNFFDFLIVRKRSLLPNMWTFLQFVVNLFPPDSNTHTRNRIKMVLSWNRIFGWAVRHESSANAWRWWCGFPEYLAGLEIRFRILYKRRSIFILEISGYIWLGAALFKGKDKHTTHTSQFVYAMLFCCISFALFRKRHLKFLTVLFVKR